MEARNDDRTIDSRVESGDGIGAMDDIRIYNRALSANEIKSLYLYERNPLTSLAIQVKTIRLSLFVELGRTYQLESSTDLKTWAAYGEPFTAVSSISIQDVDVENNQQNFRITEVH